ncbi:hypothetical protein yc1106_03396 [Curvularia clavata]|uniref:Glutamyl-tRNA synthetase n=1 Tax=Curvularia clavata TaxID=95742 RepID=A0A9Q8Z4H9_CURCL|nr:hypothetical protein yc1106_03396 [Curvularia clavata]
MSTPYDRALAAIDAAHALDPTSITVNSTSVPYELHYAQKCTSYLSLLCPSASEPLRLAIRAQHFRRWEVPRSSYPATRSGYLLWRSSLKKRQAEMVQQICLEAGYSEAEAARVGALVRKEGLKTDEETQTLEDVACLVFLEERLEAFVSEYGDAEGDRKVDIVGVVRKTWGKMSEKGREVAKGMQMGEKAGEVVREALEGV